MESNSLNAISWVFNPAKMPWRSHFYFNEIKFIFSEFQVIFQHVEQSANSFVDSLAKLGADRSSDLLVSAV